MLLGWFYFLDIFLRDMNFAINFKSKLFIATVVGTVLAVCAAVLSAYAIHAYVSKRRAANSSDVPPITENRDNNQEPNPNGDKDKKEGSDGDKDKDKDKKDKKVPHSNFEDLHLDDGGKGDHSKQ